jgi:sulfite exporter TauE/SafE
MYCRYCGNEISEGSAFCPSCGASQQKNAEIIVEKSQVVNVNLTEPARVKTYALLGFIFGIVGISLSWYIFVGASLAIPGIILSSLGLKSISRNKKANVGLLLSILGLVINIVLISLLVRIS